MSRREHPAAPPPPPPVPGVLHRASGGESVQYVIGERMGSGGFATVYAGEENPGHKRIAIKCIPKTRMADSKVREKVISEVEIHRAMRHPNVVEFRGVFQDNDYVYILLELCSGGTVLDVLKQKTPFSEDQTASMSKQLLEGLVYLHKQRVIHRDLKLQNFLLDENMTLKIADFGLAAQLKTEDEMRMTVCGTPSYLSPEVLMKNERQTYSVDIWATGVCAFLMLTGRQPFQSKDKSSTYKKIQNVSYAWPAKPELSENARNFVDMALQRDPAQRPSASELLQHPFILRQDSRAHATPAPTLAPAPTPTQVGLPVYSVRIWWDYSHRYGLAYLLRNHVCGACFNDSSRILVTPDESLAQYWETPQTPQPEIISMRGIENSPLKKKLLLIKHFAEELKRRARDMDTPPLRIGMPTDEIAHVKYWARTKDGVLFRMVNHDIQGNFRDHTKVVIEPKTKQMYFETGHGVEVIHLKDLSKREQFHEARKRFNLVKEMAKDLV